MKKVAIVILITLVIETGLTFALATQIDMSFMEIMVFTGMGFSVLTFIFSSSGGVVSEFHSSQLSGQTGLIQKREPFVFRKGGAFFASLLFFLVGLVIAILIETM